jgi:lysophospholipase L1-like esterase
MRYIALGDSMSIDLYPALDAGETDVAVALERRPEAGVIAPLGASSLLARNDDERWPEFIGRDLTSTYPGVGVDILATDGATIGDVFDAQLAELRDGDDEAIVTVTVGGNDLLSAFAARPRRTLMERIVRDIGGAYDALLDSIDARLPRARLLLTTVYDPSDLTGVIPGVLEEAGQLPLRYLDTLNTHIRTRAMTRDNALLADVHAHFLGHGASAEPAQRWYWRRSLVEPSALGASEIRRVWAQLLDLT